MRPLYYAMGHQILIGETLPEDVVLRQQFERSRRNDDIPIFKVLGGLREQVGVTIGSDLEAHVSRMLSLRSRYAIHEELKILAKMRHPEAQKFLLRHRLVAFAKNTEHLSAGLWAMNILAGCCEQSWVESVTASDSPFTGVYNDPYEKQYLERYAEASDGWLREEPTTLKKSIHQNVCTALEGNCRRAFEDFQTIILQDNQAMATWLIKHPKCGEYGDWTTFINLNTGEVYLPGKELLTWVFKKSKEFSIGNMVVPFSELKKTLGADNLRIRFDRMVNPASSGFSRVRNRVLGEQQLPKAA